MLDLNKRLEDAGARRDKAVEALDDPNEHGTRNAVIYLIENLTILIDGMEYLAEEENNERR